MPTYKKKDFPVRKTRRFLEPGPIVLVSSRWKDETNIMTMGWHMMLDYAVFGCYIWDENHSFELIRRSRQCVINVPTFDMLDKVIGIGNSTGADTDKFVRFGLTPVDAAKVDAPLIRECYANFECRLAEARPLYLGRGESACRDFAEVPEDRSLPRRWRLHGCGPVDQPPRPVQAPESLSQALRPASTRTCCTALRPSAPSA